MQQKIKRSWSIRSRSSIPAFASDQPVSSDIQTDVSEKKILPSSNNTNTTTSEPSVLKTCKDLLTSYESLCVLNNAPRTDPKVLHIKKQIQNYMPQLYQLAENPQSNTPIQEIRTVKNYAQAFLRSFSDGNQPSAVNHTNTDQGSNDTTHNIDGSISVGSLSNSSFDNDKLNNDDLIQRHDTIDSTHLLNDSCSKQKALLIATHELMSKYVNGKQSFDCHKPPLGLPPDEIIYLLSKNQFSGNIFHPTTRVTQPGIINNSVHPNVMGYPMYHSYDNIIAVHRR